MIKNIDNKTLIILSLITVIILYIIYRYIYNSNIETFENLPELDEKLYGKLSEIEFDNYTPIWNSFKTNTKELTIYEPHTNDKIFGFTYNNITDIGHPVMKTITLNPKNSNMKALNLDKVVFSIKSPINMNTLKINETLTFNKYDFTKKPEKIIINEDFSIIDNKKYNKMSDLLTKIDKELKYRKEVKDKKTNERNVLYYYSDKAIEYTYITSLELRDKFKHFMSENKNSFTIPENKSQIVSIRIPYGLSLTIYSNEDKKIGKNMEIYIPFKYSNIDDIDKIRSFVDVPNSLMKFNITLDKTHYTIKNLYIWNNDIRRVDYSIPKETAYAVSEFNKRSLGAEDNLETIYKLLNNYKILLDGGQIKTFDLVCLRPKAQNGYITIGDVFVGEVINSKEYLEKKDEFLNKMCCVPEHCYREVREWKSSDKLWSITTSKGYFAIYLNPYTRTLVGTTDVKGPSGFVGKLTACPKYDDSIDNLIETDKKIRDTCKMYKKVKKDTPILPSQYKNEENKYLEDKLTSQDNLIKILKEKSNELRIKNSKDKIITQEYNRSKLQKYLINQKDMINNTINRLNNGSNKISVNLKYPIKIIDNLIDIIANSDSMEHNNKMKLIKKLKTTKDEAELGVLDDDDLKKELDDIVKSCPEFNLSNYVKKDPPCFGCYL